MLTEFVVSGRKNENKKEKNNNSNLSARPARKINNNLHKTELRFDLEMSDGKSHLGAFIQFPAIVLSRTHMSSDV